MKSPYDAVLLIAYGGPDSMDDVRPFLENVLRGKHVPPQRLAEVVDHYRAFGGKSPLNELIQDQARRLGDVLAPAGLPLPVYVGMRNWKPTGAEGVLRLRAARHDGVFNQTWNKYFVPAD